MLQINIPGDTLFNESTNKFKDIKGRTIELEHSLISISKWESKWKKPFLSLAQRTEDEIRDYIRCMTITPNVDPDLYLCITNDIIAQVQQYIDDPCTATKFRGEQKQQSNGAPRSQTSEKIYGKMVVLGIPFECQKWHLNRLLTLIHECEILGSGSKMSRKESAKYASQMNAIRKAKHHTRG